MSETTPAYKVIEEHMSEAELQTTVIKLAQRLGWIVAHFRPCRTETGWRTPVEADGKGFPDLVLVRPASPMGRAGRVIYVELKSESGKLTVDQKRWREALFDAGAETHVIRPRDLDWVREVLLP